MGHVALKYTFAPKPKTPYDAVDFRAVDKLDVDGDGVPDDEDKCLSTPKGVQVDKHGCPPDEDHDVWQIIWTRNPTPKRELQ